MELAGFEASLPVGAYQYKAIEGSVIQAVYGTADAGMVIRKGDISGDHTRYAQQQTLGSVTLKGENGRFSLALWDRDGYTYSVRVSQALPQLDMLNLVRTVA